MFMKSWKILLVIKALALGYWNKIPWIKIERFCQSLRGKVSGFIAMVKEEYKKIDRVEPVVVEKKVDADFPWSFVDKDSQELIERWNQFIETPSDQLEDQDYSYVVCCVSELIKRG